MNETSMGKKEEEPGIELAGAAKIRRDAMVEAILAVMKQERTPEQEAAARQLADELMVKYQGETAQDRKAAMDLESQLGMSEGDVQTIMFNQLGEYFHDQAKAQEERELEMQER